MRYEANGIEVAQVRCPIARAHRDVDVVAVPLPTIPFTGIWATLAMNKGDGAGG